MGVGWIDNIYNNTGGMIEIKSVDARNNGNVIGPVGGGELDGGAFRKLHPRTHYSADWFAIPWYFQGKHYKAFKSATCPEVRFYASQIGTQNFIIFEDPKTGKNIARQSVPYQQDFHCTMRFDLDGVYIQVVNNHSFTAETAVFEVMKEGKWVADTAVAVAGIVMAA
jgi:hypothetical protein